MANFDDIPEELVELIVNYLPNTVLKHLVEIPRLGIHAQRALYSVIIIGDNERFHTPFIILSNQRPPRLKSPSEFIKLLDLNPHITPRRLLFGDPFDALALARQCPNCLDNVEIELAFWFPYPYSPSYWKFYEEYKKHPFKVDSVITRYGTSTENYLGFDLTKNVKSFSALAIQSIDLNEFSKDMFPNLTSLLIKESLYFYDLNNIPQQLKKLTCDMSLLEMHFDPETETKLNLPESLMELKMSINGCGQGTIFDISHLTNLKKIKLSGIAWNADEPSNLVSKWRFPSRLKDLNVEWLEMIVDNLSLICPELEYLIIENTIQMVEEIETRDLQIPDNVKRLEISSCLLSCENKSLAKKSNHKPLLNLPTSLQDLVLKGNFATGNTVILDCQLLSLNSLLVHCIPNLSLVGNLNSLTSLFLNASTVIDFEKLQYLDNLIELVIKNGNRINEFSYKLPNSLLKLTICGSGLVKARINTPRLVSLKLRDNDFQILDNHTLTVPSKLQRLDISGNRISKVSMVFPKSLQVINLSGNKLTCINGFPDNLQKLSCLKNLLGETLEVSTFPRGLKLLSLNHNRINEDWIKLQNLHSYTNLEELEMLCNEMTTMNPKHLPFPLKRLDVSRNSILTYISLQELTNLEEIDFSENKLCGSFINFGRTKMMLFSDAIKWVNFTENKLMASDIEVLLDELSTKPNFELLNVEYDLRPKTFNKSEFQPRKIRKLQSIL